MILRRDGAVKGGLEGASRVIHDRELVGQEALFCADVLDLDLDEQQCRPFACFVLGEAVFDALLVLFSMSVTLKSPASAGSSSLWILATGAAFDACLELPTLEAGVPAEDLLSSLLPTPIGRKRRGQAFIGRWWASWRGENGRFR